MNPLTDIAVPIASEERASITDEMVQVYKAAFQQYVDSLELNSKMVTVDIGIEGSRAGLAAFAAAFLSSSKGKKEGWRSMDSCPRNTSVLIHIPSLDYYGNNCVYAGMLVDMGTGERWMTFGWAIGRDLGPNIPDAWMPMPSAPALPSSEASS